MKLVGRYPPFCYSYELTLHLHSLSIAPNERTHPPIGIAERQARVKVDTPILLHLFLHPLQAPTYEPIRPPTLLAPNERTHPAIAIVG